MSWGSFIGELFLGFVVFFLRGWPFLSHSFVRSFVLFSFSLVVEFERIWVLEVMFWVLGGLDFGSIGRIVRFGRIRFSCGTSPQHISLGRFFLLSLSLSSSRFLSLQFSCCGPRFTLVFRWRRKNKLTDDLFPFPPSLPLSPSSPPHCPPRPKIETSNRTTSSSTKPAT